MAFDRNAYDLNRYYKRITYLKSVLGSDCKICKSTNDLQIDHIDPASKSFDIGKCYTKPMKELLSEISKCQLLCGSCHKKKSDAESTLSHEDNITGKKGCKCDVCKHNRRVYMRQYRRLNPR